MTLARDCSAGLYRTLLGESWFELHRVLQHFHCSDQPMQAEGVFQIRLGSSKLTRLLARLAKLPSAGQAVNTHLVVTKQEDGEEWRRQFATRSLRSFQWLRPDGLLAERMTRIEMRFRLEVVDAALRYLTANVALCLGPWRVPLPTCLSPDVTAWEKSAGEGDRIHVSVDVNLPFLGRLIAYDGTLTQIEVPR